MFSFDAATNARITRIEAEEGKPAAEFIREAVGVWSYMTADERRAMGIEVMRVVVNREMGSRA
ncbi:hypothetical protein [Aureimonas glaciei]|uniref:Uncharacterized protein n=1 Tax=Aureimonas glaciei TaxID=1776957 RepID=A0A917DH83_9HYPH|nr:hypothetical protein [Aureimonas glaciei]GGD38356.1 hypothetical protein GCM10011335_46380 [Aureimonas glaciei]